MQIFPPSALAGRGRERSDKKAIPNWHATDVCKIMLSAYPCICLVVYTRDFWWLFMVCNYSRRFGAWKYDDDGRRNKNLFIFDFTPFYNFISLSHLINSNPRLFVAVDDLRRHLIPYRKSIIYSKPKRWLSIFGWYSGTFCISSGVFENTANVFSLLQCNITIIHPNFYALCFFGTIEIVIRSRRSCFMNDTVIMINSSFTIDKNQMNNSRGDNRFVRLWCFNVV